MTIHEGEPVPSKVKYALVAHKKGTDYYIVVTKNGNLMACCGESINSLRSSESLTFFDDVFENIVKKQEKLERLGHIPTGTATDYAVKELKDLLEGALGFLGYPPKDNIEFFSLPKRIIEELHWSPRQTKI